MHYIKLKLKTKLLFREQFLKPMEKLFEKGILEKPQDNKSREFQRKEILKQGRANFDKPWNHLKSKHKVHLYNYHYFQMHFSSSSAIFYEELEFLEEKFEDPNLTFFFIDVGCGSMTSGIALNLWLRKKFKNNFLDLTYYGIDTSSQMLKRAKQLYEVKKFSNKFIYSPDFFQDKWDLVPILNEIDRVTPLFIINFSYVFASHTLDVNDFAKWTNDLISGWDAVIFYQNPDYEKLNRKWEKYKKRMSKFKQQKNYPKVIKFKYDDCIGSCNVDTPNFTTKVDIIKNF